MKYRVLIVDDHPYARKAVRSLLDADDAFTVVGEAAGGKEAVQLCGTLAPDLVLLDINMPDQDGLETTRQLKRLYPEMKIVILTVSDAAADLFTALQFGAQGYLLKNMKPEEWSDYLHALLDESATFSRNIADRLLNQFRPQNESERVHQRIRVDQDELTAREREIVACVALGQTNKQIGKRLNITENTVKNHIKNILEKLDLDNRVHLTAYAIRHGLTHIIQKNE